MDVAKKTKSKVNSINLGQQINVISANSDVSLLAALTGRDVLQVVKVAAESDGIGEDEQQMKVVRTFRNWRDKSRMTVSHIAWNPHKSYEHLIAGGTVDGSIALWTLGSSQEGSMGPVTRTAHGRSVSRVTWHYGYPSLLLSLSHDRCHKVWDSRDMRSPVYMIRNETQYMSTDASFSSLRHHLLAISFSNGNLAIYDAREPSQPLWTKRAHTLGAFCIAWHPTRSEVVATGGRDRYVGIWDVDRDQLRTSLNCISTPSRIAWRTNRDGVSTQLACNSTSGSVNVPSDFETRVAVWDTRFPNLPARTIPGNRSFVTDLHWSANSNAVFTSSRDGLMSKLQYRDGDRPYEKLPAAALSLDRHFDSIAVCHGEVSRNVGLDGRVPASDSQDPFARLPPRKPFGDVQMVRSSVVGPSRRHVFALAGEYNIDGTTRRSMCEDNALVSEALHDSEGSSVWKICSALEAESDSVLAQEVKKQFIWNATRSLSERGNVQLASAIACVFKDLYGKWIVEADHIVRAAHIYLEMLRSIDLEVEARELAKRLNLFSTRGG